MSRYNFNTPCPHCGGPLSVDTIVVHNVERYGNPQLAKAECCGAGVYIYPVLTFRAEAYRGDKTEDNWGRTLRRAKA